MMNNKKFQTLYFDIETNGLEDFTLLEDLETVHCMSIFDPVRDSMLTFHGDGIPQGLQMLNQADTIVGHNVLGFDIPALQKLYNWSPNSTACRR